MKNPCIGCIVQPCCSKNCKERTFYVMEDEMRKLLKDLREASIKLPKLEIEV